MFGNIYYQLCKLTQSALNKNDAAASQKRLTQLKLPLPAKPDSTFKIISLKTFSGKSFKIDSNEKKIEKFLLLKEHCHCTYDQNKYGLLYS